MYRVAVIQNGIEMQHSGYADATPMYTKLFPQEVEDITFNRFTGTTISELFFVGSNYLLDYDALIIGTNATSDGDVYNVLLDESNKQLLNEFIKCGKGLLICSQKKFKNDPLPEKEKATPQRSSHFLLDEYEYSVVARPEKSSEEPSVDLISSKDHVNLVQDYILTVPNILNGEKLRHQCEHNAFQPHYYRDYIVPNKDGVYLPLLIDTSHIDTRNLCMVISPIRKERVVISTMALDWAGHCDLLKNIINYLVKGLPTIAFVKHENQESEELKLLASEVELYKIAFEEYIGIQKYLDSNHAKYHSLVVFSPAYDEQTVGQFWTQIRDKNKFLKAYYFKTIFDDLALVKFSNNSFIEYQKRDVVAWLTSKYKDGLWDNSFWKTYDVFMMMHEIHYEGIQHYIAGIFDAITDEKHFKNGSYDGVLAPTCGLFEIMRIIESNYPFKDFRMDKLSQSISVTQKWLLDKYENTTDYNKQFIIRSFYLVNRLAELQEYLTLKGTSLEAELRTIIKSEQERIEERHNIDIILRIETCVIYQSILEEARKNESNDDIHICLKTLFKRQYENGKWENVNNTALIIHCLIKYKDIFLSLFNSYKNIEQRNQFNRMIDKSISVIRREYVDGTWEQNIVTSANSLRALVLFDNTARYRSKDFFNAFISDTTVDATYNSLELSLSALSKLVEKNHEQSKKLNEYAKQDQIRERKLKAAQRGFYNATTVAVIVCFLIASFYILLAIKDSAMFVSMLAEPLMWVPILIGTVLTGIITTLSKFISRDKGTKPRENKRHKR